METHTNSCIRPYLISQPHRHEFNRQSDLTEVRQERVNGLFLDPRTRRTGGFYLFHMPRFIYTASVMLEDP